MLLPEGLLPEDKIPQQAINCQKCSLAGQGNRIIWGEGNPDAAIYILLDNPGAREDKFAKPYVCGTRATLNLALKSAGLDKNKVYITYVLRCRPTRKYDKKFCRTTCLKYLWDQLQSKTPQLIVCLGNVAAQSFLENDELQIKFLRGRLIHHRGFPCMFSYHPVAVRRRPNLFNLFLEDWKLIASKSNNNRF